jgi:hypothetical protein
MSAELTGTPGGASGPKVAKAVIFDHQDESRMGEQLQQAPSVRGKCLPAGVRG